MKLSDSERVNLFKQYQKLESDMTDIICSIGLEPLIELNGKSLSESWLEWADIRNTLNEDYVERMKTLVNAEP